MLLSIDVGNTQIKLAVFEQNTLLFKQISNYLDYKKDIETVLKINSKIQNLVIASVGKLTIEDFLSFSKSVKIHFITNKSRFPFQNLYKTPTTLGIDRMVLAAGAVFKYPNCNRLVIDAGTCVTYDYIDKDDNYYGGAISPGIKLRYMALNNFTAKLPLLSKTEIDFVVADTTDNAIHSGVVNGILFEIEGFINHVNINNENFIIILTGGDAEFLAKRLKNTIFANSNFLLESLNLIYQYNTHV